MICDSELLEKYHRHKDHKSTTRSRVRGAMRHWARLGLEELGTDNCEIYRDARLNEGASPATVRGELSKLIAFAKWRGIVVEIRMPKSPERCPKAWSRRELRTLFNEAERTNRNIWGIPGRVFWPGLLGLCYDTGERIGAVLQIEWADIQERTVYYKAEYRKGGARDAVGAISRYTQKRLNLLRPHAVKRPFVHGSPSTLWKAYKVLLEDAGLPSARDSKFHRLRRTHATELYKAGRDASASLGHSSDAITRKSYIDWTKVTRYLPWQPKGWWWNG